ncbi:MAG: arsenite methyltransferase [Acidimicrobiales bacterium]|jgi:SAM-dependent methyltransferase
MATGDPEQIYAAVRDRYADAARGVQTTCCGPSDTNPGVVVSSLYGEDETAVLPNDAVAASLGCGKPTMFADLRPGEVVLDLGSGGGIDVLLSARRVGPDGMAYGLDMTPEMLELARKNQAESGLTNVEFLEGTIENIPLPNETVDVVISNCVVNLSPDKDAVVREAFRVLKAGGRLAISDIVLRKPLSETTRGLIGLWTGCVSGALVVGDYQAKLQTAGFDDVFIEPSRVFERDDIVSLAAELSAEIGHLGDVERDEILAELSGSIMSASVRAKKR